MKKNWIYFFMLMAITVMPLTSCSNDDDELKPENEYQKPGEDYVEETRPVTAYDGLSWLQNNLVVVDANGEVIRRVYGKPLDASQQTVISVPVNDLADADSTFLRWVAPGKEVTKVDGGYDYNLTDRKGNAQGAVSFRAVEDEAGVIARLSVAPGTVLKLVTEVLFIDAELWPENADYQKVEKNKIYWMEDYEVSWSEGRAYRPNFHVEKKLLPFYCMQDNANGKEGILVWLSPDDYNYYSHPMMKWYKIDALSYLSSEEEAQKVVDLINLNRGGSWNTMLADMKRYGYDWYAKPYRLSDEAAAKSKFVLGVIDEGLILDDIMCFEMDNYPAELEWVFESSMQMYRYMQIQIIPPFK
jgi:hypothetical protein